MAATEDAARLDLIREDELHLRVERSLTLGDPANGNVLDVLERADELVQHLADRIHRGYVAAGASRQDSGLVSLRELVAQPPLWTDRYVDLAKLMRANPAVTSTLLQTAELACFDAL